jgi:hypothetical protein
LISCLGKWKDGLRRTSGGVHEKVSLIRRKSTDEGLVKSDARMISLDVSNLRSDVRGSPFAEGEMDLHAFGSSASLPQSGERVAKLVD